MKAESNQSMVPDRKRFDVAVLIGRFQPFHNGHASLLEQAFEVGDRVVLVLGSAGSAPSPRNPFSAAEREQMIRRSLSEGDNARLQVIGQRDVWDTPRWAAEVRRAVGEVATGTTALVGYHKDATSSYLASFPDWTFLDAGRRGPLDATPLRELLLSDAPTSDVLSSLRSSLPDGVFVWISVWAQGPARDELTLESIAIRLYRQRWGTGPFLSVHALVRSAGGVLLLRRDQRPGKGLWELPGDLLLPGEQPQDGAHRAFSEQTGIDITGYAPVDQRVFAHPDRSLRGRIATHAYLYEPDWGDAIPPVRPATPSLEARWIPVGQIPSMEGSMFEDHFHVADQLLGGVLTG
jgi:bifunctional NMN adenylyltransferase/nudix hydrolase